MGAYLAGFAVYIVIVGVWLLIEQISVRTEVCDLQGPAHREELRAYGYDSLQVVGQPRWFAREVEDDYADAT
jgi:hypothetical protein